MNNNKQKGFYINSLGLYLKELNKYNELTKEDEIELFNKIRNYSSMKLLKIESFTYYIKYNVYSLNKILLFKLLVNNESYKMIIDSLIDLYSKIDSRDDRDLKYIIKYKLIANKLGRPLNDLDLEKYFKLNRNIEVQVLSNDDLLYEVNRFKLFKETYHEIFTRALGLVVPFAKDKAIKSNLELIDLINDGNFGLMRAIDLFDIDKGNRFSTYAVECIKDALNKSILCNKDSIRLPINYRRMQIKFFYRVDELEQKYNRKLSYEEIAKELNISLEDVKSYYENNFSYVSENQTVGEDDDVTIMDFVPDDTDNYNSVYLSALKKDIEKLYGCLTPREILVVKMMFGIGEFEGNKQTLENAGAIANVSHERVRQILAKSLRKMKIYSNRNKEAQELKDYMTR